MGQNQTKYKRVSKEDRQTREILKNNMVSDRVKDIENLQGTILKQASDNSSVTTTDVVNILTLTETAKTQVQRGGSVLTKSDLIAIILALDRYQIYDDFQELQRSSVNDLNVIIRSIIYDTSKVIPRKFPSISNK